MVSKVRLGDTGEPLSSNRAFQEFGGAGGAADRVTARGVIEASFSTPDFPPLQTSGGSKTLAFA